MELDGDHLNQKGQCFYGENTGLTKRELFSAMAMQAFITKGFSADEQMGIKIAESMSDEHRTTEFQEVAYRAVSYADALLEGLYKGTLK